MNKLYTIYDAKTETYYYPMRAFNKMHMMREISDIMQNPENQLGKHPEDYTLFEIGSWDETSGKIEMYQAGVAVGNLTEFKAKES